VTAVEQVARGHSPRATVRWRLVATHLILIAVGLVYVFPFVWMLGSSLKTSGEFFSAGLNALPAQAQWNNYADAWSQGQFGRYFFNTVLTAIGSTLLMVAVTSASGYAVSRTQFPGKGIVIGVMIALFFMPGGYTIVPLFDLVARLGLLNSLAGIILVITAGGVVYNTTLYSGYFATLPKEIEESALVDGAGPLQLFWYVAFPQALPMTATVALFHFMWTWNSFFIPLVFTLGNPKLRTLAVGMQAFIGENQTQWTWICAGAVITVVPIMLLFFFLQRYFVDAIAGAVKG
jgi:ABC-type glycerol-3-phosphate transport system permease component